VQKKAAITKKQFGKPSRINEEIKSALVSGRFHQSPCLWSLSKFPLHEAEAMQSGLLDLGMTNEDPVISHAEIVGAVTNIPVHPFPTPPTHFAKVRFDLEPESPTG
jgi:hypothetical protein